MYRKSNRFKFQFIGSQKSKSLKTRLTMNKQQAHGFDNKYKGRFPKTIGVLRLTPVVFFFVAFQVHGFEDFNLPCLYNEGTFLRHFHQNQNAQISLFTNPKTNGNNSLNPKFKRSNKK